MMKSNASPTPDQIWPFLHQQALAIAEKEPPLTSLLQATIINHSTFADALSYLLAQDIICEHINAGHLHGIISEAHDADPSLLTAAKNDLIAIMTRDPAATSLIIPFLFFKGYRALQGYRVAHWLWHNERKMQALYLQSRIARCFSVDIHPAATIGQGIMMDHANGIVIGETTVVEDNVSFLHSVTLGGTGKETGDRHPKIRSGVMIGAGAKILGNIEVGTGARVAAGSVVLENVPARVTVAGIPARIIGDTPSPNPCDEMNQVF